MYNLARVRVPALLGALALGAIAVSGCRHNSGPQESNPRLLDTGVVLLRTAERTLRVEVEVARTPLQRERGLMFRRSMPAQKGMLFIFERQEVQTFWMKNTYIPLDMIFIDEAKRVVGVVENAAPMTTDQRAVEAPSRYVLEVNGGFAKAHGVGPGTKVSFEGISAAD